jgi:hypothetical protein
MGDLSDKAMLRLPFSMMRSKKIYISNNQQISKLKFRMNHISSVY